MNLSIRLKIIFIVISVLFFMTVINISINAYYFSNEYSSTLQENTFVIGTNLKFQLEKILGLGILVENVLGFDEQLKENAGKYSYIEHIIVTDLNGNILFTSNDEIKEKISDATTLVYIRSGENIVDIHSINNEDYFDVFVPVYQNGDHVASIIIAYPVSIVKNKVENIYYNSAIIALLAFLFSITLLVSAISLWVNKPLKNLISSIEDAKKGGMVKLRKMKKYSNDEIGQLTSSFNDLIEELNKSQAEINKYTKNLEELVNNRTKDIDQKVREIEETKVALLNMMEDSDDTNKTLVRTQGDLEKSMTKLKEMDAKKDEFISIAAHELKTPLTAIRGFSQLLMNEKIIIDQEKKQKFLRIIESETKRLAILVTDILDLSRIDIGTIKFTTSETDINDLMENIQKEMDVPIKEKKLDSEYKIESNLPKITTDRERLIQILVNLITNSIKYTPKGKITVSVFKDNNFIHFSVKDTGIGIKKENFSRIFERFYQVDSSYTRSSGGTGLGLSLCKEFANLMGGKVWFESEYGKGSEFHFTVPVNNPLDYDDKKLIKA